MGHRNQKGTFPVTTPNTNQVIRQAAPIYVLAGCNVISCLVAYVTGPSEGWMVVIGQASMSQQSSEPFQGTLEEYAHSFNAYLTYVDALTAAATLALEFEKEEQLAEAVPLQ
jgi:hypothetical protein